MGSSDELMWDHGGLPVKFGCANRACDCVVEGVVDDAVFDTRAEYASDGEDYVETKLTCDDCGDEYTVAVRASAGSKSIFVVDFPDIEVEAEDASFTRDYDDYLADYRPDDPYGVYNRTVIGLDQLFHQSDIKDGPHYAFQQMIYLQHFIAFEAYLSDRLIKIITNDPEKLLALVGATPALRENQPKLIDIAKDPNYVVNATKNYLQRFSFHDLPRVAEFYKAVLKIDLFENEAQQQQFATIIKHRHDLVHRSGRDNDGKDIDISFGNVFDVSNLLRSVVARIEGVHTAYTAKRYFEVIEPATRDQEIKNLS